MSNIQLLGGGAQIWSGERVKIKEEYVNTAYQRRFSKGRTAALSAVFIGGITAFAFSRNLFGFGTEGTPRPPGDTAISHRAPRQASPARRLNLHGVL